MMAEEKPDDPQTYAIIGAAMAVHRTLGHGFLESVYQAALSIELDHREIPHGREVAIDITYRDVVLPCGFRADFLCFDDVIVETKALDKLAPTHKSQLLNYLVAAKLRRGLLINFGEPSLEWERVANFRVGES